MANGTQATVDYDALARKHGGAAAGGAAPPSGSGVDYDALAQKHGGSAADTSGLSFIQERLPPPPHPTFIPGYGAVDLGDIWRGLKSFGTGVASVAGSLASTLEGQPAELAASGAKQGIQTGIEDVQRKEAGRSPAYRAAAAVAPAVVPGLDPAAMERSADIGRPEEIVGGALAPLSTIAAPRVIESAAGKIRAGAEARNLRVGSESVGKGLGIPPSPEAAALAGPQAPDAINSARDLQLSQKDLAAIERATPVTVKGSAGTFARARNILDYSSRLWDDAHAPMISRNVNLPIKSQALVDAGMEALTKEAGEASPASESQVRRAKKWLVDKVGQPRSLGSADKLLREINTDLETPAATKPYGPVYARAQVAVRDALRSEIERVLTQDAGEQGVAEINQRYGALRNIADRAIQSGLAEAKAEGRASALPDWLNAYLFAHTGGVSGGMSVHPSAAFTPKASKQLASGMTKLAGTSLEPPPLPTAPTPRLPMPPDTSGPTGAMGPSAYTFNAPGPPPPPVEPKFATEATGTVQPIAMGPGAGGPTYTGPRRPVGRTILPALPAEAGMAPPSGMVGQEFRRLGLSDLVTPRQTTTLETMMRGPRWRSMDPTERIAAIRAVISPEEDFQSMVTRRPTGKLPEPPASTSAEEADRAERFRRFRRGKPGGT